MILTVTSQKGGVGKTTLSINLAYSLAKKGYKTLLVDADPQGAVGLSLSKKSPSSEGFYDVILSGGNDALKKIMSTRLKEFSILPSGHLESFYLTDRQPKQRENAISKIVAELKSHFDVILVDTPAGLFGPSLDFLKLADYTIIPQQTEPLAARSVPQLLQTLAALRKAGYRVQLLGLILSMVNRDDAESLRIASELQKMLPEQLLIPTTIYRDALFVEASAKGLPVNLIRPNPTPASETFDRLAGLVEQRMNLLNH